MAIPIGIYAPPTPREISRFLRKIRKQAPCDGGCWVWMGTRHHKDKYGQFKWRGKTRQAHLFAWHVFRGAEAIPAGHELDHRCTKRQCVNPWHLAPKLKALNIADANHRRAGAIDSLREPRVRVLYGEALAAGALLELALEPPAPVPAQAEAIR